VRHGLLGIFAVPAILFAISLTGLIMALLLNSRWDMVFAVAAGSGILSLAWSMCRRRD
jgi:hypothetical protein